MEESLGIIKKVAPGSDINANGVSLPFPMALSDDPLRAYLGDYGQMPLDEGIAQTYSVFRSLLEKGLISADKLD